MKKGNSKFVSLIKGIVIVCVSLLTIFIIGQIWNPSEGSDAGIFGNMVFTVVVIGMVAFLLSLLGTIVMAIIKLFHKHWNEKLGRIKKTLQLVCLASVGILCFSFPILLFVAFASTSTGIPTSVSYHNAEDLYKATGVKFPEVIPVDSFYYSSFGSHGVGVKFVPKKELSKRFFRQLDNVCKTDSCCWRKGESSYTYYILPERPLDRTKGTHFRMFDTGEGKSEPDWDGDFVFVEIPFSGDTITIEDGWTM